MPTVVTMTGPGTATVTDDAAVAIMAQTAAMSSEMAAIIAQIGNAEVPGTLLAELSAINDSLNRIADTNKATAKAVSDLNSAIGTLTSAATLNNVLQSSLASNQIQTNNYQMQVTKEAMQRAGIPEPTMPSIAEQLKTGIKDGVEMHSIAVANGAISKYLQSTLANVAEWIKGTAAYQTIEEYLKKIKDTITSIEIPSPASILNKIKSG